jgi:elongation factor G
MAHIDAGKTTVSERVLYLTGRIHTTGEVHDGETVLDYLQEERERGITITSAATSCEWNGYQFNLIDTPGHVDFTVEVERSLRVLDGAIGVFCGVAGVEAQSETVWRQADRYQVPRVAFVNKLDRVGANFDRVVQHMRDRLGTNPVPVIRPIGKEKEFSGVIDLIRMVAQTWPENDARNMVEAPIPEALLAEAARARDQLIENVAEFDDAMLEKYVEGEPVSEAEIIGAIRKGTLLRRIVPVLGGSALRDKGIQQLLDAVCMYLPSPLDLPEIEGTHPDSGEAIRRRNHPEDPVAALAFKSISDITGELTFLRIYSGTLRQGDAVYNPRTRKRERIGRLVRMHANQRESIDLAMAGYIVAAVGIKYSVTGDTLCSMDHPITLESMDFPPTVISIAIEPKAGADRDRLSETIAKLTREDPTFRARTDENTGQMVISGMGELHLEVLRNRIERDFRVPVNVGKPKVAYRQTLRESRDIEARHIKQTGGSGQFAVIRCRFAHKVTEDSIEFRNEVTGGRVPREYISSVEAGLMASAEGGGRLGFPFQDVEVTLYDGQSHDVDSSDMAFQAAGNLAFRMAIEGNTKLLEPIMKIEVTVPEDYLGDVIGDLNSRRVAISDIAIQDHLRVIQGKVPIAEMFSYSTTLRGLTQGRGTFSMEPLEYAPAPFAIAERVLKELS